MKTIWKFQLETTEKVDIESGLTYVGSYQLGGGAFVGHVFELLTAKQLQEKLQA